MTYQLLILYHSSLDISLHHHPNGQAHLQLYILKMNHFHKFVLAAHEHIFSECVSREELLGHRVCQPHSLCEFQLFYILTNTLPLAYDGISLWF